MCGCQASYSRLRRLERVDLLEGEERVGQREGHEGGRVRRLGAADTCASDVVVEKAFVYHLSDGPQSSYT